MKGPLGKPRRDPLNRAFSLPRLPREHYQGGAVVHWTLTLFDRAKGWLTPSWHGQFRELMLHAAAREGLVCPAYCLMPDHLHLVWMGLRPDTDQFNGMAFLRTQLEPLLSPAKFQPQAHDEVLREDRRKRNAFAKVCFYVAANPVRAELVGKPEVWPFTGCVVPGYPRLKLFDDNYWPKFWKLYSPATATRCWQDCSPSAWTTHHKIVGDEVTSLKYGFFRKVRDSLPRLLQMMYGCGSAFEMWCWGDCSLVLTGYRYLLKSPSVSLMGPNQ